MNLRDAAALALMSLVPSSLVFARMTDGGSLRAIAAVRQCNVKAQGGWSLTRTLPAGGSYQRGTARKSESWGGTIATVPILGGLHHQLCSGLVFGRHNQVVR